MQEIQYKKFKKINIYNDLPIKFFQYDTFYDLLKSKNINTLEDLFILYDKGYLNDEKKKGVSHLKSITELLRFQYLNEPFINNYYLNSIIIGEILDSNNLKQLTKLGFTLIEFAMLYYYYEKFYYQFIQNKENISILELLKYFYEDKNYQNKKRKEKEFNLNNDLIIQNIKCKIDVLFNSFKYNNKGVNNKLEKNIKNNIKIKTMKKS